MKNYIFTDLACETNDEKHGQEKVISDKIKKITLFDRESKEKIRHTVFYSPRLWMLNNKDFSLLQGAVSEELLLTVSERLSLKKCNGISILVVGLGNPHLTTDALGSETVKNISVTHNKENFSVYAVAMDVMGNTGIDTVDAVRAYTDMLKPSVLIAVDALMAKSYERLASTVQISDGGITPGGGFGMKRRHLDIDSVGVPVISVGVPMVVNSSTMIAEALIKGGMDNIPEGVSALLENGLNFFVTPKEADIAVRSAALLISSAINSALSGFCEA